MNRFRQQKYLFALLALLVVFAGCKGESPTAPPIQGPGGGGSGTPPTGATIAITVANPNPLTDSSTAITATVTVNGQPAPAGTAVEFGTTLGRFEDTGTNTSLRTTNAQGQAIVSLTSATAGTANVTVVVNNAIQRATVTFSARPVTPTPPTTAATITSVNPNIGRVEGGDLVTITGTNFRQPVRVYFDINGTLREAQVTSVTPTQIQILTPRVDLATGQTLDAPLVVFIEQGTPNEQRVTSASPFTFRRSQLTPVITTLSPPSGPLEGGTQTTIIGSGFESFVQVFFGLAEAQIINVTFDKIVVISPPSRDTGSDAQPVTGPIAIRVVNVNSGTTTTLAGAFRYHSAMAITAVTPTEGPFTGGTRVTIDGTGFDDPVAVTLGGHAAQVIRVSASQIIAQTVAIDLTSCGDAVGEIRVVNVSTGLSADAGDLEFSYRVPQPVVLGATNPVVRGAVISVRVLNAFGFDRLRIGDTNLNITSEVVNADGTTTFTAVVPANLPLATESCAGVTNVTAPLPTPFNITYESATTGCTDTMTNATTVEPQATPRLTFSPTTFTPFTATINPGNPVAVPPVPPSTTP
ncbi:MAG: IPT/TIG domain-containing protein, partial [Thermoanaerobaculia bacterium]